MNRWSIGILVTAAILWIIASIIDAVVAVHELVTW